jgi:hypothetical protein
MSETAQQERERVCRREITAVKQLSCTWPLPPQPRNCFTLHSADRVLFLSAAPLALRQSHGACGPAAARAARPHHDAFPRRAELQPQNPKSQTSCSTTRRLTRQREELDFKVLRIKRDAGIGSGRGGEESSWMHGSRRHMHRHERVAAAAQACGCHKVCQRSSAGATAWHGAHRRGCC